MRIVPIVAVTLVLALHAAPAAAQAQHESDESKFMRLTRQLEQSPLGDTDKSTRTWLLQWAQASKDVTVRFCKVLDPVPGEDVPNSGILATQQIFGNAAYQISHPDRRGDLQATQLAGARSALRAYAALLAKDPKARIPRMDELLRNEAAGTLDTTLAPVIGKQCAATGSAPKVEFKPRVHTR
jgi:hypothetical protein